MNSLILLIFAAIIGIFVVILSVAAVLIVSSRSSAKATIPASETPLDALKRRYARGEITREQFQTMRQELETSQ